MINYPIKFEPILKEKIWGGNKLKNVLNKKSNLANIGESWEIADVDQDATSVVANGRLKGKNLQEILTQYTSQLLGGKNYAAFGAKFPLLIKFIDAREALSIQVHPGDEIAKARHDSFGKTEMWYVMQADKDAEVIVGFNEPMSKEKYAYHVKQNQLEAIMNSEKVKEGDCFFIPSGKIHAIGAGALIAEIQQTSDITYRIYDWNRTDDQGNPRELHTNLAIDAIDYSAKNDHTRCYDKTYNESNTMAACPYFTTNFLNVKNKVTRDYSNSDSFVVYMCTKGSATIAIGNHKETITNGETVLIPATAKTVNIIAENAAFLEVYIDDDALSNN